MSRAFAELVNVDNYLLLNFPLYLHGLHSTALLHHYDRPLCDSSASSDCAWTKQLKTIHVARLKFVLANPPATMESKWVQHQRGGAQYPSVTKFCLVSSV